MVDACHYTVFSTFNMLHSEWVGGVPAQSVGLTVADNPASWVNKPVFAAAASGYQWYTLWRVPSGPVGRAIADQCCWPRPGPDHQPCMVIPACSCAADLPDWIKWFKASGNLACAEDADSLPRSGSFAGWLLALGLQGCQLRLPRCVCCHALKHPDIPSPTSCALFPRSLRLRTRPAHTLTTNTSHACCPLRASG